MPAALLKHTLAPPGDGPVTHPSWACCCALQKLKATAFKAVLAAIKSLDTWAGPIKSAAAAVALQPDAAAAEGGGGGVVQEGEPTPPRDREVGQQRVSLLRAAA